MEYGKDPRIKQVERILALMYNATYPGKGMWRFRVTCEMIARGANAEAETGANSICESDWFAAAVEILKMSPKNACYDWNCFSPKEMTEIAREFLNAAKALVLWVDAERKNDAEDQEIDYRSIGFMPEHPGQIVLEKLGGYENGPTLTMVKELLFTENRFRDVVYNPLLFEQFEHVIEASGAEMEHEEPTNEADIQECDAVIRALYEDRAEREHRQDEGIPSLNSRTFQSVMDDLSASNEAFLEKEEAERDALCKEIDAKFGDIPGFGTPKPAVDAEKLAKLYAAINVSTLKIEQRLDRLLADIRGNGDISDVAASVSAAIREEVFDEFKVLTEALVGYGDFDDSPIYDLSGIKMRLEEIVRIRFASDEPFQEACLEKVEDAFEIIDYPCKIVSASLIEGLTEDCHRLCEWLAIERKEPLSASASATDRDDDVPTGDPAVPLKTENYSRFRVEWFETKLLVTDIFNFADKPYEIPRPYGNAAKAIRTLIQEYVVGNELTHESGPTWRGAFQSRPKGPKAAARFAKEQIFMLPLWSEEKGKWLLKQHCGKWRLWTNDEMELPMKERIANFIKAHPNGM